MELMRNVLSEFADEFVAAGTDDQKLNRAYNNFNILDKDSRFPLRYEPISMMTKFQGYLKVTDSFDVKATLEIGKLVNVMFTINQKDADKMVDIVKDQLIKIGLVIGRLTGTQDTTERHVSLMLRAPYTAELGKVIEKINTNILSQSFSTAAKLKIVTPTDIRTSESALELISDDSCHILREWQVLLHAAVGSSGNKLPPLHITHGNSPIKPASFDEITKFHAITDKVSNIFRVYGLDLTAAFTANREKLDMVKAPGKDGVFGGSINKGTSEAISKDLDSNKSIRP